MKFKKIGHTIVKKKLKKKKKIWVKESNHEWKPKMKKMKMKLL